MAFRQYAMALVKEGNGRDSHAREVKNDRFVVVPRTFYRVPQVSATLISGVCAN